MESCISYTSDCFETSEEKWKTINNYLKLGQQDSAKWVRNSNNCEHHIYLLSLIYSSKLIHK